MEKWQQKVQLVVASSVTLVFGEGDTDPQHLQEGNLQATHFGHCHGGSVNDDMKFGIG